MKHHRWAWVLAWTVWGCTHRVHPKDEHPRSILAGLDPGQTQVLELDLTAGVPESPGSGSWLPTPAKRTYVGLIRALGQALKNERVAGLYVGLGSTQLGWAQTEELGSLLYRARAGGKTVVCHAHTLSNASLWLTGKGCDRVWISPGGGVDAVGIAVEVLYFRGALDKLRVQADFMAVGKYKSAAEGYTREGPSEEAKESLTGTLASIRTTWLDSMEKARHASHLRESLEHGPWSATEAKARGLADEVGYESEARAEAEERGKASRMTPGFGPRAGADGFDWTELLRLLAGADDRTSGRPHLAVVPAQGAISLHASSALGGGGIIVESLAKLLRKLRADESVKAVVLRVDSPGGSALASDLIWHELMQLRKKKPIVASVGNMAASGGYYLACAAQRIVAPRTSIVGSIGVVGGKFVLNQSLAELGINAVLFPASSDPGATARAGYESPLVPWDEAVRERVQAEMLATYQLFLERVAEGRGLPVAEIRPVAEGRIWSGAQGKERGLVDQLGGLEDALRLARELGGLDDGAPITVEGPASTWLELLALEDEESVRSVAERLSLLFRSRPAALLDWVPERLRPLVASLAPLWGGERTVAAVPFALTFQ